MSHKQVALCNDMPNSLPNIPKRRMKQTSMDSYFLNAINMKKQRETKKFKLSKSEVKENLSIQFNNKV